MAESGLMRRVFGSSGEQVSIVGLGGEGILRTTGEEKAAKAVIECALAEGITYFDCARAYAGSEEYYGLVWSERSRDRKRVFQASKSAIRTRNGALADLERTLATMQIDYLDLWQIHDVRTEQELEIIGGPGGALEAFQEAKAAGKVRFIGVTGHHDPQVLTRAIEEWPVDSVMMPVNPVEAVLGGFLGGALSAAKQKGVAVIGMKVLGASHYVFPDAGITAESLIRFALSHPIAVAIVGCSTPEEVKMLSRIGSAFTPLPFDEQDRITEAFRPYAERLAYYRGNLR